MNPDVVPSVITPAYVDAVMKKLDHIYGNAVRLEVATKDIPPQVITDLRAIYLNPQYRRELQIFSSSLVDTLSQLRPKPGDRIFLVHKLLVAKPNCILVQVVANYSAVIIKPESPRTAFVVLTSQDKSTKETKMNPTPWAISYEENIPPSGTTCR